MAVADVFVDTAGFLALWDAADQYHQQAVSLQAQMARKRRHFLTSDYVVDETVTLLLIRHSHDAASDFLRTIEDSEFLRLEWVTPDRFSAGSKLFRLHDDKEWSFTDCVSFALMRELKIHDCFTTDHHFRQGGFTPLLEN